MASLPNRKAAGPDGAPSQLLKCFSFKQITHIAQMFTDLSHTTDYRDPARPDQWDHALAIMIPKHTNATTFDKHRTISLMNQLHKLYTKWLLALSTPALDSLVSEHQLGFRRTRQASEAIFVLHRLTELVQEWEMPLTILRLDISKAFDRMRQSSILQMLVDSPLHRSLVFNLTRELIGTNIQPHLYGTTTPAPVPLARGAKQGAPESGLLFISTLNWLIQPYLQHWTAQGCGVQVGQHNLTHLLFVDDFILLSTHPDPIHKMLRDIQPALHSIGLTLNEEKSSYLTTSPAAASKLPGSNANGEGLKILGRTHKLHENTSEEIDSRIGHVWGKFHAIKRILSAPTPLPHRLTIFKARIGQALLWGSETRHLTKKNLQRIRGMELKMHRLMIPPPHGHDAKNDPEFFENWKHHIRKILQENGYFGLDRQWIKRYHSWGGHVYKTWR